MHTPITKHLILAALIVILSCLLPAASAQSFDRSVVIAENMEAMPVGHRLNAWLATVADKLKAHGATFKKYPPKDIGLGMQGLEQEGTEETEILGKAFFDQ